MQDPLASPNALASSHCVDCDAHELYARGRCRLCYRKHVRDLKTGGVFVPLKPPSPLRERLLGKTTPGFGGCVVWTGAVNKFNYGVTSIMTPGKQQQLRAHRAAYELFVGPIPEGMQVDHLCHNRDAACPGGDSCPHRRCINPYHLEAVSPQENQLRSPHTFSALNGAKTHCVNGHEFTVENTYRTSAGSRQCRQCHRDRARARYHAQRSQPAQALLRVRQGGDAR